MYISYIVWDPSPYLFDVALPLIGRPLLWYGLFFAMGVALAYQLLKKRSFKSNPSLCETLSFYVVVGGLLGARLGDLLFYQSAKTWLSHPLSLIKIWEGGLSSHGGAVGILLALYLFSKRFKKSFLELLDCIVIPVVLAAPFIRVGNFFNQEILGTPSTLPWAVVFMHPADSSAIVPRHPAQLYEALCYLVIWAILMKKKPQFRGHISALFLILVFGSRLLIECVKNEQSVYLSSSFLTMGQYLSLPLIIVGIYLLVRGPRQQELQAQNALSDQETHDHIEDKS